MRELKPKYTITSQKNVEIIEESLLPEEALTPLQELSERALTVKFEGKLTANDINDDFKKRADFALESLVNDLETDADFDKAKADIKACEETEKKLKAVLEEITSGNKEVADVKKVIEGYIYSFSGNRKTLDKAVKSRDAEKKKKITDTGKNELSRIAGLSQLSKIFKPDNQAIDKSIKNRRLYSVMEEEVAKVVYQETERLAWMELSYQKNTTLIENSIANFPGIYPDKGQLALEPTDKLELIIQSREDKQTLLLKEQAEKAAKAKKAAQELLAKIKADKEESARQTKLKTDQEAEAQRKLAASIPDQTPTEAQSPITPPPFAASTVDPPAKKETSIAPPNWGETPTIAANPFTEATFPEPQAEETVLITVEVTVSERQRVMNSVITLDGVVSVKPYLA